MDEPTSSLSEQETETLFNVIRKLVDKNIAIIYISHKLDEVMFLSDDITVIRDGKNSPSAYNNEGMRFTQDQLPSPRIWWAALWTCSTTKKNAPIGDVMLEVKDLQLTKDMPQESASRCARARSWASSGMVGSGRTEMVRALVGADKYRHAGQIFINGKEAPQQQPQ